MRLKSEVSLQRRIDYCLPDISLISSSVITYYYLLYFYTDVYSIPVYAISGIFLACNIFDAVNDCFCAYIMCRVRSRHGIYRPYILWTALPLAITSVLLFATPEFSDSGKIIYVVLINFIWNTVFSFFSIARDALLPVMGRTESERVTLNSLRIGLTIFLMALCSSYLLPMVDFLGGGDQKKGFLLVALGLSAIGLPVQLLAFLRIKEPEHIERGTATSFLRVFATILKDRYSSIIILMNCLCWVGNTFRNQSIVHYLTYAVQKPEYITLFILSSMGTSFVMQFFFKHLIKIAKPSVLSAVGLLGSVASTVFIWIAGDVMPALIFANILFGITSALPSNLVFILLAGRIDYFTKKNKLDYGSLVYSVSTFFQKVGTGIGGALLAWVLAFVNYDPDVVPSETVIKGITFNFIWGTAAAMLLAGVCMLFYFKIEKETERRIKKP